MDYIRNRVRRIQDAMAKYEADTISDEEAIREIAIAAEQLSRHAYEKYHKIMTNRPSTN